MAVGEARAVWDRQGAGVGKAEPGAEERGLCDGDRSIKKRSVEKGHLMAFS